MKCLQREILLQTQNNSLTLFCKTYITELFPSNHIEYDEVFVSEVDKIETCTRSIESLSGLLFNPFELNTVDHYSSKFDIDLDMNYYELDYQIALNCNYYFQESISAAFGDKIKDGNISKALYLCHVNISLKANLPTFAICL